MPKRMIKCGECGANITVPDGDWNSFQAPRIAEWEEEHTQLHGDEVVYELEPNPMRDG
jgi:hypothetical protein